MLKNLCKTGILLLLAFYSFHADAGQALQAGSLTGQALQAATNYNYAYPFPVTTNGNGLFVTWDQDKSFILMSENTDGSVTFWMWSLNLMNCNPGHDCGMLYEFNLGYRNSAGSIDPSVPRDPNGNANLNWWTAQSANFQGYKWVTQGGPGITFCDSCGGSASGGINTFGDPILQPSQYDYVYMPSLSPADAGTLRPVFRTRLQPQKVAPGNSAIAINFVEHQDPTVKALYVFDVGNAQAFPIGITFTLKGASPSP